MIVLSQSHTNCVTAETNMIGLYIWDSNLVIGEYIQKWIIVYIKYIYIITDCQTVILVG